MADARPDTFTILVVRTGGIAGLRREWSVNSVDAPEVDWWPLVDACPWDTAAPQPPMPDRFVWRIEAHTATCDRRATVGDNNLVGAWRELVDQVRSVGRV